jgi:SAM-dependent methyltransferase
VTALVADSGDRIHLDVERWRGEIDDAEWQHVAALGDPVLDVGCGPGRVVAALTASGRPALGIDVAPAAVAQTAARGAPALRRSVFSPLPNEGRWGGVVLLDGNVGIGGDPIALLRRARQLLRAGGQVLVEADAPGQPTRELAVRIETTPDRTGPWFRWAVVAAGDIGPLLRAADFTDIAVSGTDGRWFATGRRS